MGRRSRRRGARSEPGPTTDYEDAEGNVLTLRDDVSEGTLRAFEETDSRPGASGDDRWQRRTELMFERLAVRWTIAGLPLERQQELIGRYRMADAPTRLWVRETIDRHSRRHGG
ncbi:MAG: hypothetical protein NVSMB25_03610 [Thermoleophilaceae bacterium]